MQQSLDRLKLNQTLAEAEANYKKLSIQNKLLQAQQEQKQASLKAELESLKLQQALAAQKHSAELASIKQEKERIAYQNSKLNELNKQHDLKQKQAQNALRAERAELELKLNQMEAELKYMSRQEQWKKRVLETVPYPVNPLDDKTLTISDRRIQLNDVIIKGSADYVCERIHFFNNKSKTDPIFIVIDRCLGGSIMEGARIVQAIKTSPAPVHVVVKSLAASMAAIILAQADHSYAFPNAFVLHHQPSSAPKYGNITQQSERTELMKQWASRLHTPVAKRWASIWMLSTSKCMPTTPMEIGSSLQTKPSISSGLIISWKPFVKRALSRSLLVKCRCSASGSPSKISSIQQAVIVCIRCCCPNQSPLTTTSCTIPNSATHGKQTSDCFNLMAHRQGE